MQQPRTVALQRSQADWGSRKVLIFRILLVDDFVPWHRTVTLLLQKNAALQVISAATSGLEAVTKAQELRPDLVLLDIGLPGMTGIEAASQILAVSPGSKIIFLTENDCEMIQEKALSTGACGYVLKSSAMYQLLPAVEAALEGRRLPSELQD
jgi:DNA-binding NarL/FixJ family response regulator